MANLLNKTACALSYDLAGSYDREGLEPYPNYNDIFRFVRAQMERMPGFLRLAVKLATVAFAVSRLFVDWSLFHQRDASRRRAQVNAWRFSKLGPCRDLMKFYTSLAVLALFSRPGSDSSRMPAE